MIPWPPPPTWDKATWSPSSPTSTNRSTRISFFGHRPPTAWRSSTCCSNTSKATWIWYCGPTAHKSKWPNPATTTSAFSVTSTPIRLTSSRSAGKDGDINPHYELRIDGPELVADALEPNDNLADAVDLGSGDVQLTGLNIHQADNSDFLWSPRAAGRRRLSFFSCRQAATSIWPGG